jgi:VIT1/CCC1 family predicted Fe2+/Mn2+ transporter
MGDYLFGGGSLLDVLPWRPFAYGIIAVLVPVLVGLIVMLVFGFTTARVAGEKGRNAVGWFFIGFFLSLLGLAIALALLPVQYYEQHAQGPQPPSV